MSQEILEDITPPVIEVEDIEPLHVENNEDVADKLTRQNLETTLKTIIDEKLALNETSTDGEEEADEDEEIEDKGIGIFPILIIGGVLAIGAFTFFSQNRPITSPTQSETENVG